MKEEDLIQIKKTIHFALRNSKFKNDTGFVFDRIAQVSLDNIEKQLNIHSVVKSLPSIEESTLELKKQFDKDYSDFSDSKKFYYKRGWRMACSWMRKQLK